MDQLFVASKAHLLALLSGLLPAAVIPWISLMFGMIVITMIAPVIMMYLTWLERKVIARMQNRPGPNRVGPFGLLQPLADGVKMMTKEDIIPAGADKMVHYLAPVLAVVPAMMLFSVIPFGRNMIANDLNVGLLFFLAVTSIGTFAVFCGGWASRSKYSLLGAMRSVAQMVSYEIPMVLAAAGVVMATGTLSLRHIVEAQAGAAGMDWFVFTPWGFVGCLMFFICGVAEVNRTPFDLAEGESELVGGFHTEFGGMKFALFYMGEFLGMFAICAIAATLFLGGWQGPILPSWLWFFLKTYALIFIMIWLRGTFPRLRIDQLMSFAWKCLLPIALVNMAVAAIWLYVTPLVGWSIGVVALWPSIIIFSRLAFPITWERRTYHYAE